MRNSINKFKDIKKTVEYRNKMLYNKKIIVKEVI